MPPPLLQSGGVVVRTAFSLISAGTERSKIEVARKSLLGKAFAKPEQVRLALELVRQVGVVATYRKISARLNALSPLGYSLAGVVVAAGRYAGDLAPGDRVACAGAGFANHAEYVYVPRNLCVRVPQGVSLDAAAYATVGAIALQGVRQAQPTLGETFGVIGLGLVGILTVQLLRCNGCRVIGIDIDPERCALAVRLGAYAAVHPSDTALDSLALRHVPAGLDAVILCATTNSSKPVLLAGRLCRDKGRVVVVGAVGLDIPRTPFYEKELDIRMSRSYGPGRYDPAYEEHGLDYPISYVRWSETRNLEAWLDQLAQNRIRVDELTTHRFSINDVERAYELLQNRTGERYLGILIDYGDHDVSTWGVSSAAPIAVNPPARARASLATIGLVGSGSFAQSVLLPPLSKLNGVRFRTVVSSTGLSARTVAERYGFEQCAADVDVILQDPEINLVLVATRHDSHAALAARAIAAGKAVFLEKPLALSEEELARVIETSRSDAAPILMVGFNRRFARSLIELQQFVRATRGPMIMHYRVNAGFVPRETWVQHPQLGGGRIVGEICHFVDVLSFLCGSQPVEVYASAMPDQGRYCRDNAAVTLRFADGSIGSIVYAANGARRFGKERVEAFCDGRSGLLDDFRLLTLADDVKMKRRRSAPDKGHAAEMAALVKAVREGGSSPVPLHEAVNTTRATFAVLQSIATGLPVAIETCGGPA